jgi:DNA-damage-inducible protein D
MENIPIPFEGKEIRKIWHNEQWYYAIIDIIEFLINTDSPRQYWTKVKNNLLAESQLQPFWLQLKMQAKDGKMYKTDAANTEGVLRIVMSVPSPKAEPLKLWLAEQGKRTLEETENPELGFDRLKEIYQAKGYSNEWIESRLKSIGIRKELTDEWNSRGVKEGQEYSILTAEISKGTFGMTPAEYKEYKGLNKQNLRDHMTDLELIFTMLGEAATKISSVRSDAQGFEENREAAIEGGLAAGNSRENFEKNMNLKVVSSKNYLQQIKEAEMKNELPPDTTSDFTEG